MHHKHNITFGCTKKLSFAVTLFQRVQAIAQPAAQPELQQSSRAKHVIQATVWLETNYHAQVSLK